MKQIININLTMNIIGGLILIGIITITIAIKIMFPNIPRNLIPIPIMVGYITFLILFIFSIKNKTEEK